MAPILYFWKAARRALPSLALVAALAVSGLLLPLAGLADRVERRTAHGLQIALICAVCWALFRAAEVGRDALYDIYDTSAENNIRQRRLRTQIKFIYRIVLIGIGIAGVSMVLMTFHQVKQIGA